MTQSKEKNKTENDSNHIFCFFMQTSVQEFKLEMTKCKQWQLAYQDKKVWMTTGNVHSFFSNYLCMNALNFYGHVCASMYIIWF